MVDKNYTEEYSVNNSDTLIFKPTEYHCPIHDNIGQAVMTITYDTGAGQAEATYCLKCWVEKFDEIGIQRVSEQALKVSDG